MKTQISTMAVSALLACACSTQAEVKVATARHGSDDASARFAFTNVPVPARNDAAAQAKFTLVDGARDRNGGELAKLNDGRLPREGDQPGENFFFNASTDGGRIQVDLGSAKEIKQVNTFSWHPGGRGPQVYKLYASDGAAEGFVAEPKRGTAPEQSGWKLIANVDTRPASGDAGGQYAASIADSAGALGKFRYLLFDMARTDSSDPFGNTFFSEIDVVEVGGPELVSAASTPERKTIQNEIATKDGKYQFILDTSVAPDLTEWAKTELSPVILEWYPKLVAMLPSEGYEPPTRVTLLFRDNMNVPASAGGSRINCNADWFRRNLKGEAKGSVVHEMAHIVQNYGFGRRNNPNATRTPGWIVEGIPDYIRWFLYEPETRGAEITRRNIGRAKYDASYRITGNFLNWVTHKYDTNLVMKLNAAARHGKYSEELWKTYTGKTAPELGEEWKKAMEEKLTAADAAREQKN